MMSNSLTARLRPYGPIVVVVALLAFVPLLFADSRSMMFVIITGLLFGCYATGFNLIFGSTGQLFLCVGALAGIGGFGSALLSDRVGLPLLLAMPVAAVVAGLLGGLMSWIAVRRSLDTIFIGIFTLAFALSFENLLLGLSGLTGGESGLRIAAGSDTILDRQVTPYFAFLGLLALYLVVYRLIERSPIGWAFQALRDDNVAASLAGVNVTRYRVLAATVGSVMIGLAGALFAHYRGLIGDTTYAFGNVDVRVLVMLAFGGIGRLFGPVLGAVVFTILDELLIDYAHLREVLYGVVAIVLFLSFRRGAVPAIADAVGPRVPSGRPDRERPSSAQ